MSGSTSPPTGQLKDGTSVRMRTSVNGRDPYGGGEDDGTDISPNFDGEGVVEGRIEVKLSGETAWGTINFNGNYNNEGWGDTDALVACREIGIELGYATVSGTALTNRNTQTGAVKYGGHMWAAQEARRR